MVVRARGLEGRRAGAGCRGWAAGALGYNVQRALHGH